MEKSHPKLCGSVAFPSRSLRRAAWKWPPGKGKSPKNCSNLRHEGREKPKQQLVDLHNDIGLYIYIYDITLI